MKNSSPAVPTCAAAALFAWAWLAVVSPPQARASDWPQWGRDQTKNMVSPDARNISADFHPGDLTARGDDIDPSTTQHVRWIAKLGSNSYGNPTIAGGRVFVGTNNDSPRDPKYKGDRSNIYCLDEKTGGFLWQLSVPKLGAGKVGDWEYLGICSSPTVEGDRLYLVTNRCEVVCLDVAGMANGNDGPFVEEAKYAAGPGKPPIPVGPTDADVIWRFDMADELMVFPHNVTSSSVVILGDRVYVTTSNGVDYSHKHIITPQAPALIALDKKTGELVGEEASGISRRVMHCNWSSPGAGTVNGALRLFFGAGDGFCYGFDPNPEPDEDGFGILNELWRFDCNPSDYRTKDGRPIKYGKSSGPSEIIATAVFHDGRVYVSIGQDPEHGEGNGALSCIDAAGSGDITQTGRIWQYTDIDRVIATASIADGLLYVADYAGVIHCLDVATGLPHWTHDTLGHIWGSTLVADGKVMIGNEDGVFTILKASKEKSVLGEIEFGGPIYSSPVVANDTLYVSTMMHLYAIGAEAD